jgi:hypothetical protein
MFGAGGLGAMFPGRRAQAAVPTRFIVMHVPEGMWKIAQRPTIGATTLGPLFDPLDTLRSDITVIQNLNMQSRDHGPGGDGHKRGVPHMLTGIEMVDPNNAGGPSVDQKIAQAIGATSKFASLQFSVRIVYGDTNSKPIWSGPSRVVPSMGSPWDAYTRIFGAALAPTGGGATGGFDLKKSAMDFALADLSSLTAKLPASDRVRLSSYQDSLRDIETRLATVTPPVTTGGACASPVLGDRSESRAKLSEDRRAADGSHGGCPPVWADSSREPAVEQLERPVHVLLAQHQQARSRPRAQQRQL